MSQRRGNCSRPNGPPLGNKGFSGRCWRFCPVLRTGGSALGALAAPHLICVGSLLDSEDGLEPAQKLRSLGFSTFPGQTSRSFPAL